MFRIIRDPPSRFGGSATTAAKASSGSQQPQDAVVVAAAGGGGGGNSMLMMMTTPNNRQQTHRPSSSSLHLFSSSTSNNSSPFSSSSSSTSPSSPPSSSSTINNNNNVSSITSPLATRRLFGGSLSSWGANTNANTNSAIPTPSAAVVLERTPSRLIGSPEPPPSPPPPPVPPRYGSSYGYGGQQQQQQQQQTHRYDSAAIPSSRFPSLSLVSSPASPQPPTPPVVRQSSFPSAAAAAALVEDAALAHPPAPLILLPCPICFRTFKPESLDRHKNVCVKVATKKRKVFDSSKQRCEDLPETHHLSSSASPTSSPTRSVPSSPFFKRSTAGTSTSGNNINSIQRSSFRGNSSSSSTHPLTSSSKPTSWKDQHLNLIKTVRAARAADVTRCPYCERNFGNKAFDRHVDWCREQQSRIPKSPTNTEAKERWEARTKYRAPALRRSMRSMTRDKYSPTRSISSGYGYNYGGGGGGSGTSPAQSIDRLSTMSALPSTDYMSRHHHSTLTPSSSAGDRGGGGESLSGSRASLDSRASSTYSAASHQPVATSALTGGGGVVGGSHRYGGIGGHRMANTLGRTSGSAFVRQANERRSLRLTPTSPPPSPLIAKPAPITVQLTPISNNRASALRASLRMKNPFSNLSASFQPPVALQPQLKVHKPTPTPTPIPAAPSSSSSTNNNSNNKRPSVLQLFTSAFSRPSPASSTKNLRSNQTPSSSSSSSSITPSLIANSSNNSSHYQPSSTSLPYYTSPYQQQQNSNKVGGGGGQGRRSEPEGVESKLMTASCFTNYTPTSMTPKSPVPPPRTIKPSRFSIGSDSSSSGGGGGGGDRYNPYLSAERQMAELFDDSKSSSSSSPAITVPPVLPQQQHVITPLRPATPTSLMYQQQQPTEKERDQAEAASMEQLEMDLKSILSEISQLGKTNSERDQTARDIYINNSRGGVNKEPSPPPPTQTAARSELSPSPVAGPPTVTTNHQQPSPPKFCHSCGSSYPDRFTVKFCCQCGARRLYV